MSLIDVEDESAVVRDFIECASQACEAAIPAGRGRSGVCAILDAAHDKLKAIGERLEAIRGGADAN